MNLTYCYDLPVRGHADIDFVDVHIDTDVELYVDSERIELCEDPIAGEATSCIADFFDEMCTRAAARDNGGLYELFSYGREANETHLGFSTGRSMGRGTSPEIMMPIVNNIISLGLFDHGLITGLSDLPLWTPNFGPDRLSDLTINIIRDQLVEYTWKQYDEWSLTGTDTCCISAPTWDIEVHDWQPNTYELPAPDGYPILLVPKRFVGRSPLSTAGELLQKYVLRYRQQEHLDERSALCHERIYQDGRTKLLPPSRREIRAAEIKDISDKEYILLHGRNHPEMVAQLHAEHRVRSRHESVFISDYELDQMLYN